MEAENRPAGTRYNFLSDYDSLKQSSIFTPQELFGIVKISSNIGASSISELHYRIPDWDSVKDETYDQMIIAADNNTLEIVSTILHKDIVTAHELSKTLLEVEGQFTIHQKLNALWSALAVDSTEIVQLVLESDEIPIILRSEDPRFFRAASDNGHLRAI